MVLIFISSGNVLDILLGEPVLCQFISGWETMQSSDHDLPFAIHCDKTLYLWSFWMLGTFLSNQKCLMQFGNFYLGYPIEIKMLKFCMWCWLMHFNFFFFYRIQCIFMNVCWWTQYIMHWVHFFFYFLVFFILFNGHRSWNTFEAIFRFGWFCQGRGLLWRGHWRCYWSTWMEVCSYTKWYFSFNLFIFTRKTIMA